MPCGNETNYTPAAPVRVRLVGRKEREVRREEGKWVGRGGIHL